MDEAKKASEIEDCEDCPLYQSDCPGGWVGGPGGTPIEPPCCSWDGDEEIYEGMYAEIDYSPQKLKWMQEDFERREAEKKKADKRAEVERLKERVWKLTGGPYRHIEMRYRGEICNDWLCPYCRTWRHIESESWHMGIGEAWCSKCGRRMVYCAELEKELEE